MSKTWSWSTGQPGVNRVRIYERTPDGPLQIAWYPEPGQPERKSLKSLVGHHVYDRSEAKTIATNVSAKLRQQHHQPGPSQLRRVLGLTRRHTLEEAWDKYIDVRRSTWSDTYHTDQKRYRRFWLGALGEDIHLTGITPALVEQAINETAEERDWSNNTARHYLVALKSTLNYAARNLRWIPPSQLPTITFPDTNPKSRAYEPRNLLAVMEAALEYDLRLGVMAEVGYATLRRLGAIRTLQLEHLSSRDILDDTVPVIRFPEETDKRGRRGEAVLPGSTSRLVKKLVQKPAVQATGYLFVRGDLDDPDPPERKRKPLHDKTVNEWWHRAEEAAGVKWVKGRAFHGIKRTVTTISSYVSGGLAAASQQSGTDAETLRKVYLQSDPLQKLELAQNLEQFRDQMEDDS